MSKKTTLADRLNRVLGAMNWTPAELGRAAGVSRQAVWNWMNRPNPIIELQYALNLQNKTMFNATWIIYGDGPERVERLTPEEEELLRRFREASPAKRDALAVLLES